MNILPPSPPKKEEELNGTFGYLKCKGDQKMFSTAYSAINQTENWDYIKNFSSIFEPEIDIIYKKIEELGYDGHSGCSFMATMSEMQFIAKYGEKKFKDRYDEYEKKAQSNSIILERRRIIEELTNPLHM